MSDEALLPKAPSPHVSKGLRPITIVLATLKSSASVEFGMLQSCDGRHCPGGALDPAMMGSGRGFQAFSVRQ